MAFDIYNIVGETSDYDKKARLEVSRPKSWCKSVSAFANGKGGWLIFGISDTDEVIGLDNPKKVSEKFSEIISARIDPVPEFSLSFETIDGKTVMLARIEKGTLTPYYYKSDGMMTAFKRVGNRTEPASSAAHKELVLRGTHQSYDALISPYDIRNFSFSKVRSVFHERTKKVFDDKDIESWGLADENGKLTMAGALLVDESPLRHSRVFCTRWNGLVKAHTVMDALDDMEVSGSLLILFKEALSFCQRNSRKKWYKSPDGRVNLPDYPEESLIEGLVNALIHRSYLELGSEVHVDIFDDRIEIFSPGGMYESRPVQECDILNVMSRRRNPILADIFNRMNLMERRGSGFRKILDNYEAQHNYSVNKRPNFFSNSYDFVLTLYNLNYTPEIGEANSLPQTSPNTSPIVSPNFPNSIEQLPKHLRNFVLILRKFPSITVKELAKKAEVSDRMVKLNLQALKNLGAIRRIGTNRIGSWEILITTNPAK